MKLNKWHQEIINHRLEISECIVEVLGNGNNDESVWTDDQVSEAVESLSAKIASGSLNYGSLPEIEQAVMADLVCGSTRACCMVENSRERNRKDRVLKQDVAEYLSICKAGGELARVCHTEFPEI